LRTVCFAIDPAGVEPTTHDLPLRQPKHNRPFAVTAAATLSKTRDFSLAAL